MDYGACAVKIENAMKRLPGFSDIDVNYGLQSLSLVVDEDRTSRDAIGAKISALGYAPVDPSEPAASRPRDDDHDVMEGAWWLSPKGRLVIGTGALLILAFAVSYVELNWSSWAYVAATVVDLVPIRRRAYAGALSGTRFSIGMLM